MATTPLPIGSTSDLDPRYIADLLWRQRLLLATGALVGVGLGFFFGYLQTPEYRASAMIQIDPPTPTGMSVTDALIGGGNFWQHADFYNTQFKVLRSKSLGDKTVARLKLADRPPFQGSPDAGGLFMSHVTVEPIPESRLVNVQVTLSDPKEAAVWANTLADVYMEHSLAARVESARKAYEWLQQQLGATRQNMRDASERLLKQVQGEDMFAVPDGSAAVTQASKLNEDYAAARSRRIEIEAVLKQIAEMRSRGQTLDLVPQVATDAMFTQLSSQLTQYEAELARLKERYREAHPEVQKLQTQIDQTRAAHRARADQIEERLRAELLQVGKREGELQAAFERERLRAASRSRQVTEVETLRAESQSAKGLYDVLLQKLNETDIAASIRANNVTLIERATPPTVPIRPDRRKIATAGLGLGLLAGVVLVLARDFLDNTIKEPDEIERFLHVDLLTAVPRYDENSVHLVTEAYQNLRTSLIFARKEDTGQVILITGTAPQEGKTTTLVNLGKLLAASGEKTVVLDFDLRRAQLHSRVRLSREPGITDHFTGHMSLDRLVRPTPMPNLYAITSGQLPPNPPAILARKNLGALFDELRRHFDWILVDSPPLASVTDALLLARHVDMVVFVVEHNKIDKRLIKRHLAAVTKATPNVLGVVLNGVDVKAKGYYYYYYHQDDGKPPQGGGNASGDGAGAPPSAPSAGSEPLPAAASAARTRGSKRA